MSEPKPPFTQIDSLFFHMILDLVASTQGLGMVVSKLRFKLPYNDPDAKMLDESLERFGKKQQEVLDAAKKIIAIIEPKS
ncbi:hypothetical protein LPB73_07380 [Tardiphaga sp. 37S4]|uniref:hypothetical protein n=1 Tax=Tardiphaga sp. 37S4 TaxID=1404741 RepID=UPI001E3BE7BD|nr:hypothetical protein [Tardiphaga sp. 37S4]UFS77190.1 hypothetical protein LPB73_07380 [Tardiphaga sp. 37S4]